jgi:glycosyltransferase involved in cell wall biosynthesis
MNALPSDNLQPELMPAAVAPPVVAPQQREAGALPQKTALQEGDAALEKGAASPLCARVLHVINGEHYAGAERVQDLLAQGLPYCGFEVGFACVKPRQFAELRQSRGAPLYELPMRNRFDLGVARKIADLVRRERYALIHAHSVRAALAGSLAAPVARVPLVYHVHSPASKDTTRRWMNLINARVERFSLRRANRLVAVSESIKKHMIRQGFDPSLITVVHNGVPPLCALPLRRAPHGRWTLGTAALFRERKGIEILLRAIALVRSRGFPVRLRALGRFESADYERKIHELAADLGLSGIVEWTGFVGDVTSELLGMDLFVLPSLFGEGLPMVLLEAMAAGVPAVAADVEGVAEALRHGQDGVLVPPGDHQALARAIIDVIEGKYDWSAMRQSALKRQAQFFSERSMAQGVAEVYRQVLG